MRRTHAAASLALVAVLISLLPAAASGGPLDGTVTGLRCERHGEGGFCTGFLAGVGGTAIDVDLALPAGTRYPLLVALHGWGGSKGSGAPSASYPGDEVLTRRGYAVMRYSARGFGKSWGQTHLAHLDVEIEDLQALVSQVVDDPRFGVIPRRIGVTGISYGGGQSWLVATRPRWRTPGGTRVRVAAVAPVVPWSDLVYSLLPNGRPDRSIEVVGTQKASYVTALFATGVRRDPERPYPNYIDFLMTAYLRSNAGEPYEGAGVRDPLVADALLRLGRDRSVAWQRRWLARLGERPGLSVPVFALQGWTDDLFPAEEGLRMWRLLKGVSPRYPIKLYLGDIGHPRAANKPGETERVLSMLLAWFDHHLLGRGPRPRFDVTAATTTPGGRFAARRVIRAAAPEALARRTLTVHREGPLAFANPGAQPGGVAADPVVRVPAGAFVDPLAPHLVRADEAPGGGVTTAWRVSRLMGGSGEAWYVGQGSVTLRGEIAGTDAQYDARVWDVAPDGTVRLVDRGTYKYVGPPGPISLTIPLHGNAWIFRPEHRLLLEVTNVDFPFLRPDNAPSATVLDRLTLRLPVRS